MATLEKRGDFWRVKIRRTKAIRFNPAHSIPKPATLQSSTDAVLFCRSRSVKRHCPPSKDLRSLALIQIEFLADFGTCLKANSHCSAIAVGANQTGERPVCTLRSFVKYTKFLTSSYLNILKFVSLHSYPVIPHMNINQLN
nr:hypothetical protein [Ferrovum sp.]